MPATKTATHRLKTSQKYCACHTKRLSTRYKTRLNVTKSHACHTKRSHATLETSKSDPFGRTYDRHGHAAQTGTVATANGCERLRTVANGCGHKRGVERTHPQPPDRQSETGTLATHSGKNDSKRHTLTKAFRRLDFETLRICKSSLFTRSTRNVI